MKLKNKHAFYYFNLIILLVLISCSEKKETNEKVDFKIVEVNYDYHYFVEKIKNKSKPLIIKERNILEIDVNQNGECKIEGKVINDGLIISELKKYIIPNSENSKMPMTVEKEFYYSGKVLVTKQLLISALYDKNLSYANYSKIRNKIYAAYSEVRNDFAKRKFKKSIDELLNSKEQENFLKWEEITEVFPILYSEVIDK
jgi:hypothetical protein